MFVFRKIWPALFCLKTRFEIRPFVLLPTICRRGQVVDQISFKLSYYFDPTIICHYKSRFGWSHLAEIYSLRSSETYPRLM